MKNKFLLAASVFLLTFSLAVSDPGIPDTVRVDSITAYPGGKAILPVYFYNDEVLGSVDIALEFDSTFLTLDSFSRQGTRTGYVDSSTVYSLSSPGFFGLSIQDWALLSWIPRGNGLMCRLYFSIAAIAAGQVLPVNSTFRLPAWDVFFSDSTAVSIYPQFVKGHIAVLETPPNYDSVWADTMSTAPGHTVAVNIHGFNGENLANVALAIGYSSNHLIYNGVLFDNTRGAQASNRSVSADTVNRQILINLGYTPLIPLSPGSGPLATILFDIAPATPDDSIVVDTASYLGLQGLEFTSAAGSGFTPYFRAGFVRIKSPSPVTEDKTPKLPKQFTLLQNYPNPFNPETIIRFELPAASNVTLDIFNILGQRVRKLVDRPMPAGVYNITFDGRGDDREQLASGIYFYRLKADNFERSRMMTLLK